MLSKYPDALTCDMAETYGIFDIKRVPARLLATLAAGLRDDSRVNRAKTETQVDDQLVLLAYIADCVRWLQWSRTEDGAMGVNHPPSLLEFYTGKEKESEYEIFDSQEAFRERWKELTET